MIKSFSSIFKSFWRERVFISVFFFNKSIIFFKYKVSDSRRAEQIMLIKRVSDLYRLHFPFIVTFCDDGDYPHLKSKPSVNEPLG